MNRHQSKWSAMIALRVLALPALLGLMTSAAAAQNAERGHQLAARWCSSCHAVDKSAVNRTEAPSFMSIAASHRDDRAWLRAWLMSSHPSMPDMNLTRVEIDDIVAFLKTLSGPE